ncbi:3-(3-hydroxy-phenyl)propionate/3-hydroxycinnamic acid hydroxylase [Paraburkholderia hiiakae]|uniref:3-(3-hydroxy-phenyl)propionate/3-hydroxycinnamic acid hydroxylase n=1 Tax=Paraburkholderia hiiakae TaxID=1081782 RepID=A0ABM8NHM4_9BURK|nr:FAD-dependent monooxygenase [Paraburkholderia hiiakae]CAD6526069.1 3-(3-hydroxy-phenyl)propionate/3-hydroxycinnamic acid hydroxylase [Paraburkholderia hiiakae]
MEDVDVLVVGAGPVGLLLGTELRRDGVSVMVIEKMASRGFFCKALGITARTLEIFDDLGIVDRAIEAGTWLTGVETWVDGMMVPTRSVKVPDAGLPYGSLSLAQHETERLLEAAFAGHGGQVNYEYALDSFTEERDAVSALVKGVRGEALTVRCKWLVGCDGAHSKVRSGLGLGFDGEQYPQTFALADVDVDWSCPRGPMYRFEWTDSERAKVSVAAVPVHGSARRYRLSMIVPEERASLLTNIGAPDIETMRSLLLPSLPEGTHLSSMRWSSVYRVSHRIASAYGRGRVFIAGDAAHIHPPVGGQGMNTGLQDAHNLAWKLAYAAKGLAGSALLDSYHEERHPVGVDVVKSTSAALNAVLARQAANPAMRETQLLISYRDSSVVDDLNPDTDPALPAPGDRLPDVQALAQRFVGHPRRLHEFVGRGKHTLVGYIDRKEQYDNYVENYRALSTSLPDATTAVLITASACEVPASDFLTVLTDASGEFAGTFRADGGSLWIVRPDGHIGWRSSGLSGDAIKSWVTRLGA